MPPAKAFDCPVCGAAQDHRLVASTRLHLGIKRKWRCDTCEHLLVTVDGEVTP